VNQFRFDSHECHCKVTYVATAFFAAIIASFLMLLVVKYTGLGRMLVSSESPQVQTESSNRVFQQSSNISDYENTIIDVVNRVSPSVVMITTNAVVEDFDFFTGPEIRNIQGLGSGVIYRSDGYILTNNHVVNGLPGKIKKIAVVLADGKTYPAEIVGVDPYTDLALLKIKQNNLPTPIWGDSDQVNVGQTAIAIGNPLDENLKNTVTVGVISSKGRTLAVNDDVQLRDMIQTDASFNRGNSGGPLLDSRGNVIGINTIIATQSQGIGFSIPSNTVNRVAKELITKGYVSRPGLGIALYIHFTPENVNLLEYRLKRKLPVKSGIFIAKVLEGSEAAKAGLAPGDIIYRINGETVKERDLVKEYISAHPIGTRLKLDYYRGVERITTTAKIGELKR